MSEEEYTATHGLMQLLRYQNNYPALGTGAVLLASQAKGLLGAIPPTLQDYSQSYQINLFGDYPTTTDFAPCVVFAVVFALLMVGHLVIFSINCSRGHYFFLSLGWVFYCIMRVIGFVVRIYWGRDISKVKMGIANEVFLILPSIFLVSFNLILAQRIFTWRHPVGGSRRLFWNTMIALYVIVAGLVAMTIIASAIPYLYFLSEGVYINYQRTVKASSVFILLYSLTSVALLVMAYFFKPTTNDENLYTFQPWWIESFNSFYFVKRNAAQEAEETFMKRNHNHRHAVRVIASTFHHHNMVEGLSRNRGDLKHNYSLFLIVITTVLIFVGAICRLIVTFQARYNKDKGPLCNPVALYICWGLFETIINLLYIFGRVDLRFYRPDKLPARVRAIITAEQTGMHTQRPSREPSIYNSQNESLDLEKFETNTQFHDPEVPTDSSSVGRDKALPYPVFDKDDEFVF